MLIACTKGQAHGGCRAYLLSASSGCVYPPAIRGVQSAAKTITRVFGGRCDLERPAHLVSITAKSIGNAKFQ